MPMHRKNKARMGKRSPPGTNQKWFTNNVKRSRRREKLARIARRKQRA